MVKCYWKTYVRFWNFLLTYEVCKTLRCAVYHYMTTKNNTVWSETKLRRKWFFKRKQFLHNIFRGIHANHDCGCIITIAHFESKSDEMSVRKAPDLGHFSACIFVSNYFFSTQQCFRWLSKCVVGECFIFLHYTEFIFTMIFSM